MDNSFSLLLSPKEVIETGSLENLSDKVDWGLIDIAVPELWKKTKGDNVKVLIIDTGISEHPDLKNNILIDLCRSFVPNEDIYDINGHGTMVAGIIAAKDNNYGIIGAAPNSKIISIKVISKINLNISLAIEKALEYAKEIKPDVINMSLGGVQKLSTISENLIKDLYKMNIPIVCALGNSGKNYSCYPANYSETFAVASYNKDKSISNFSSRSPNADFALPGEEILTTSLNNQFAIVKGTSFATPFLTGIICLIISVWKKNNKNYTVEDLKNFLIKNIIDIGPSGKDEMYGYGIINARMLKNLL